MSDWPIVRFEDLAVQEKSAISKPYGSAFTAKDYVVAGVPLVRGVNLGTGRFLDEAFVYISEDKADQVPGANLRAGDLVFTHRGVIGQVAMVPRTPRFPRYVVSTSQVKARLDPAKALPEFYVYWFLSPVGQAALRSHTSTVGVPGLVRPVATIKALQTPCPPMSVQQAIAALLGALDDKIALNDCIAATALSLSEALYLRTSIVLDWPAFELRTVASWHSGGTPSTSEPRYWGGELPWISARSLKNCWIEDSDRRLTELGASSGTRLVPPGTVIFVVRGSSLKDEFRVGLTQREVAFGQDCKALVPNNGVDGNILFHGIRAARTQILELVDETSIGAGRLATDLISQLHIRIPPDSNADVVSEIRLLDQLSANRVRENRTLSALRDVLLPELMSGRLRIRDAAKVVEAAV